MRFIICFLCIFSILEGKENKVIKVMDFSGVSDKTKVELAIINKLAKKLSKEKNLFLSVLGSDCREDYYVRAISFQHQGLLSVDELRELIIYLTNLFIENFNASEEFLSYVKTPYGVKNFEIGIYLRDKKGYYLAPSKVSIAKLYNSNLIYSTFDEETYKITEVLKESYEEALEKLPIKKKVDKGKSL